MAGNGNRVIELDAQRMTAMAQRDVATLNALIADELVYTHSSARLDTKQSLIEQHADRARRSTPRSCRPTSRRRISATRSC